VCESQFFICALAEAFGWAFAFRGIIWQMAIMCLVKVHFITCSAGSRISQCSTAFFITARRFNELPTAARAGMSFCTILVDGHKFLVQMQSPGRWLKVLLSRQNCRDGIIRVDGRIPVDGSESRVTVTLSKWLCKNRDSRA
jgi:hypothetical protein